MRLPIMGANCHLGGAGRAVRLSAVVSQGRGGAFGGGVAPAARFPAVLGQQRALEGVEADRADVEGLGVERPQFEAGAGLELGADLFPEPLAHLV